MNGILTSPIFIVGIRYLLKCHESAYTMMLTPANYIEFFPELEYKSFRLYMTKHISTGLIFPHSVFRLKILFYGQLYHFQSLFRYMGCDSTYLRVVLQWCMKFFEVNFSSFHLALSLELVSSEIYRAWSDFWFPPTVWDRICPVQYYFETIFVRYESRWDYL